MAIADDLTLLKQIQLDLRTAIEAKGVPVGDAPFVDYPSLVMAITAIVDTSTNAYWEGEGTFWSGEAVTFGES